MEKARYKYQPESRAVSKFTSPRYQLLDKKMNLYVKSTNISKISVIKHCGCMQTIPLTPVVVENLTLDL